MPPTPVYDAMQVLRFAIYGALAPLMGAYEDTAGNAKCYWWQADQEDANRSAVTLPYVIFQSQDLGGRAVKYINSLSWAGLVVVRAHADTQDAAEDLMRAILPGMASLTYTGYSIRASYDRPVSNRPDPDRKWMTAHQWRISINIA
jgi:hypothetical protein